MNRPIRAQLERLDKLSPRDSRRSPSKCELSGTDTAPISRLIPDAPPAISPPLNEAAYLVPMVSPLCLLFTHLPSAGIPRPLHCQHCRRISCSSDPDLERSSLIRVRVKRQCPRARELALVRPRFLADARSLVFPNNCALQGRERRDPSSSGFLAHSRGVFLCLVS